MNQFHYVKRQAAVHKAD